MSSIHEADSAKTVTEEDTSVGARVGEGVSYVVFIGAHNDVCSA
jgi:hypothetical protein